MIMKYSRMKKRAVCTPHSLSDVVSDIQAVLGTAADPGGGPRGPGPPPDPRF